MATTTRPATRHLPAAGLADRPARGRGPRRGRGGAPVRRHRLPAQADLRASSVVWFAAGASISLFSGRLSFALGVAIALAAVFASQRGWRALAVGFALLCPLASPVAALFLACGAIAHSLAERNRAGIELAAAGLGAAVLITFAFPKGTEPFVLSSFNPPC